MVISPCGFTGCALERVSWRLQGRASIWPSRAWRWRGRSYGTGTRSLRTVSRTQPSRWARHPSSSTRSRSSYVNPELRLVVGLLGHEIGHGVVLDADALGLRIAL